MGRWRAPRHVFALLTLLLCATAASHAFALKPAAGAPTVTCSYPHAPDEPGWDGAFQDPGGTKLVDGVAGGNARHSVMRIRRSQAARGGADGRRSVLVVYERMPRIPGRRPIQGRILLLEDGRHGAVLLGVLLGQRHFSQ